MSLIRQVWLLLALTLVIAFAAAFGITVHSSRQYLETQLGLKNNDTAQFLALTLSQQKGDATAMELVIASQFDTGHYEAIRLIGLNGRPTLERRAVEVHRVRERHAHIVHGVGSQRDVL